MKSIWVGKGPLPITYPTKRRKVGQPFQLKKVPSKGDTVCQLVFRIYNIRSRLQGFKDSTFVSFRDGIHIPSRELTYPTWGKGKSSTQKCLSMGYVSSLEGNSRIPSWTSNTPHFDLASFPRNSLASPTGMLVLSYQGRRHKARVPVDSPIGSTCRGWNNASYPFIPFIFGPFLGVV